MSVRSRRLEDASDVRNARGSFLTPPLRLEALAPSSAGGTLGDVSRFVCKRPSLFSPILDLRWAIDWDVVTAPAVTSQWPNTASGVTGSPGRVTPGTYVPFRIFPASEELSSRGRGCLPVGLQVMRAFAHNSVFLALPHRDQLQKSHMPPCSCDSNSRGVGNRTLFPLNSSTYFHDAKRNRTASSCFWWKITGNELRELGPEGGRVGGHGLSSSGRRA